MTKWVHLDSPGYYAGQTVTGKVVLQNPPAAVKEVKVKLLGRGRTHWTERVGTGDEARDVTRTQTEKYIKAKQLLWTEMSGMPIRDGQVHPFAFQLPVDLPPTFKGAHGDITYTVFVKFKRHGNKSMNMTQDVSFTVTPMCSFGHMQHLMTPVVLQKKKTPMTLFSKKGAITAQINLPKQGFVIGEPIPVSGEVKNDSSVKIKMTKARVRQKITYRADSHTKCITATITKVKREELIAPGGGLQVWSNVPLPIPPDTPPSVFGPRCKLFEIDHQFEFYVDLSGMHIDMQLEQKVMLGTVPSHNVLAQPPGPLEMPMFGPAPVDSFPGAPMFGPAPVGSFPGAPMFGPAPVDSFPGAPMASAPPVPPAPGLGATSGMYPVIGFQDAGFTYGSPAASPTFPVPFANEPPK